MRSDGRQAPLIRPMLAPDRPGIAAIVEGVGNFNRPEIACALELVDLALGDSKDYRVLVAQDFEEGIVAYACWGPTPLTRGTYDLYWIATRPDAQGRGCARALLERIETLVREEEGRLLVAETSSRESYADTVRFYRRRGFEEASRIRDFYDVGDDRILFLKYLAR